MPRTPNLTVAEAASLSGFSKERVRKAIMERQIRSRKRGAHVYVGAVDTAFLTLCSELKIPLDKQQKRKVRTWLDDEGWNSGNRLLELNDAVRILVPERVRTVWEEADRYARLKDELIVRDPEVKAGEPVLKGSRISVYAVHGRLARGESIEDLREDFPHLSAEAIDVAYRYADANPRRGRPVRHRSA